MVERAGQRLHALRRHAGRRDDRARRRRLQHGEFENPSVHWIVGQLQQRRRVGRTRDALGRMCIRYAANSPPIMT